MTKKLSALEKKNRKPASRACVFCHSKHLQCSNERPCKNCIKRNLGHECRDVIRKKAKYLKKNEGAKVKTEEGEEEEEEEEERSEENEIKEVKDTDSTESISNFNSNYLNQEYLMLGDILINSKPSSPTPSSTTISPSNIYINQLNESRPFILLGNSNQFYQFKQNESNDYISPLISHHLYQTVQDIYSNNIINFDYPQSYHLLTKFLKTRFSGNELTNQEKINKRKKLLIILRLIASYRPTFISAHKSLLKPFDLQFLEMSFQRSLIDYENLSKLNSSPTIIWRRTGEIVSISNDLINLLGFNLSHILSKRTFIMELMYDDESIVNYFKLFKSVAVGNLHLSIKTNCKLINFNNSDNKILNDFIEFCSVWTVKRDLFDLPMLIVGQFLPILPAGEGVRMY
ncbi:hypothetical protein HYPBUDRAFT_183247 [Hyphopichia burtonii NRRL Y-1933]|uniref:Glucose starvation modulator protein 1 n=1 Tax=Hyphopichia burtonii NRRL Y-1933 TaxID=984485 RepID=A0A1E4RBZ0_9ASCO|nr:hypothetical protein HYPBUDRAFT_183247 [Hyphopichia burtonii NRRL Y-1933]ODV64645.1 hypothetical protein HYPBUDRAFT_183247 [Hyphopichia burtonii NRRL Y-1933]